MTFKMTSNNNISYQGFIFILRSFEVIEFNKSKRNSIVQKDRKV